MSARVTTRRRTFTARSIDRVRPEPDQADAIDWFDDECPGLSLRVSPGGTKTWNFLYRIGKTSRRVKIGRYDAQTLGLAQARTAAREKRVAVETHGADPAHDRKAAREASTVADLATLYMQVHAKPKKRTWQRDEQRINLHLLPTWGTRPVTSITRPDAHDLLDTIVKDHGPYEANRVKSLISKMWNIGLDRGYAQTNPCHRMAQPAKEHARNVVLDNDSIKHLLDSLTARPGDAADAVLLAFYTAQRDGMVFAMQWPEIDVEEELWTIPGSKMKNGLPHVVPLTAPVLAILARRRAQRTPTNPWVFPVLPSQEGRKAPRSMTPLYHQRKDMRALADIHGGSYRWHDLRRVFRTRLGKFGVPREMCGRVMSHVKPGDVTSVHYDEYEYLDEKRAALDLWAQLIERIVHGQPTKVLQYRPKRQSA